MPSLTHEELVEESIFNYVDPKYAKSRTESSFSSGGDWYRDLAQDQAQQVVHYESAYKVARIKQLKPSPSSVVWKSFIEAFKAKAQDAFVASSADLAEVLLEIANLAFEDEEDQFGPIRTTYHAFKYCMKLALELAAGGRLFKPSDIMTDHNGDIRITWARGDREAELICPSDGQPYVYYASEKTYGTDQDLTTDKITERIRWAMDGK